MSKKIKIQVGDICKIKPNTFDFGFDSETVGKLNGAYIVIDKINAEYAGSAVYTCIDKKLEKIQYDAFKQYNDNTSLPLQYIEFVSRPKCKSDKIIDIISI